MSKKKIGLFTLVLIFSTIIHAGWLAEISQGEKKISIKIPREAVASDSPWPLDGPSVVSIDELDNHWIAAAVQFKGSSQRLVFNLIDMRGSTEGSLDFSVVPNVNSRYRFSLSDIAVELWYAFSNEHRCWVSGEILGKEFEVPDLEVDEDKPNQQLATQTFKNYNFRLEYTPPNSGFPYQSDLVLSISKQENGRSVPIFSTSWLEGYAEFFLPNQEGHIEFKCFLNE